MNHQIMVSLVNGFVIGILIGSAWQLEAKLIFRILFVNAVVAIAFLVICIAQAVS